MHPHAPTTSRLALPLPPLHPTQRTQRGDDHRAPRALQPSFLLALRLTVSIVCPGPRAARLSSKMATAVAAVSARPHLVRAQAFRPAGRSAARPAPKVRSAASRASRRRRGDLLVVAVRVENEEVALGTVAPDFEESSACCSRLCCSCAAFQNHAHLPHLTALPPVLAFAAAA